jgi:hypothetical protein
MTNEATIQVHIFKLHGEVQRETEQKEKERSNMLWSV